MSGMLSLNILNRTGVFWFVKAQSTVYFINPDNGKKSTVGRHPELSNLMCKVICKQLEIPSI